MSYWKTRPIVVADNITTLSDVIGKNDFLNQANNDLLNFKSNLTYTVYHNTVIKSIDQTIKKQCLNFINEHYIANSENKLLYSEALFDYFINNALIIIAHTNDVMIGMICGKLEQLIYKNNDFAIPEIDFLCLHTRLRNLYLAPFLISAVTKEIIERFNISCAFYTVANQLNVTSFCEKGMYHRCINIDNLILGKFIDKKNGCVEKYNNFATNNTSNILLINKFNYNDDMTNEIYNKLIIYRKTKYDIYLNITIEKIVELINNDGFHHIIQINKFGQIAKYYCFYEIIHQSDTGSYKEFIIYMYYSDDNTLNMLDIIKYCYDNHICDIITTYDEYDEEFYHINNFIKGTGSVKYYMMNKRISQISKERNGLVTI